MTQEEKELVLIDLCGRLPYDMKIKDEYGDYINVNIHNANIEHLIDRVASGLDKLVLRPLSSMTEEEYNEMFNEFYLAQEEFFRNCSNTDFIGKIIANDMVKLDWLNKNMFDFRWLIPKGLAEIAPEELYENETDSVIDNTTKITVGCKIRSKTNPDEILRIVSDDCHGDKFECSNGDVLSLKQIEKHYDLYIEENKGTIVIN